MCDCGTVARLMREIAGKDATLRKVSAQVRQLQKRLREAGMDNRLPRVVTTIKGVDPRPKSTS